MNRTRPLLFCFIICLSIISCKKSADQTIVEETRELNGKVSGWNLPSGKINVMGYFVPADFQGTISSNGDIAILLPDNFMELTISAFAKANSEASSGYEMEIPSAQDTFTPAESILFEGRNQPIAMAGKYYGFEVFAGDEYLSTVYPASSIDFMKSILSPGSVAFTTGWYYFAVYAKDDVNIDGSGETINLYTADTDESYSATNSYGVHLKPGWNYLKYEITAIAVSADAKYTAPSRVMVSSVEQWPENIDWIALDSQQKIGS